MRTKQSMIQTMEKLNKEGRENKELKAEALTFLNTSVEIGNKIFCYLPIKNLRVDHEMYQRPLQKTFNYLLDNWDDEKCDPIIVNYRNDGFWYVVEGQNRAEAAKAQGINQIVCNVFVGLSLKEEAEIFASQYDGTTKLSPVDSYRANIIRGELVDSLIKDICDKYGLIVQKSRAPKVLNNLTIVRRIIKPSKNASNIEKDANENLKIVDWIFNLLQESKWESYIDAYNSDILQCLWYVHRNNINSLETARIKLVAFFKTSSPKELKALGNIDYPDCGHGGGIYRVMMDIINEPETPKPTKISKRNKVTSISA